MDIKGIITVFIFIMPGVIALLGALFNWDWFYQTRMAEFFVNSFGRVGSRFFYGVLGVMLILASLSILRNILI
ncbi:MAG: immunity 17 family protein [Bacteroidales bacterium]